VDISSVPFHEVQAPAISYSEISNVPAATGNGLVSKPLLNLSFEFHKMEITNLGFKPPPTHLCAMHLRVRRTYAGQTSGIRALHAHGQPTCPWPMLETLLNWWMNAALTGSVTHLSTYNIRDCVGD